MDRLARDFLVQASGTSTSLVGEFHTAGFDYHYYPAGQGINPFSYLVSILALIAIIRRERPQIVHTFDTKPSIIGRLAAKLAGTPVIIGTITGLGSLYIVQENLLSLKVRPFYEMVQKMMCRISDLTIFYTEDDANFFRSRGLAPRDKTVVLPGSGVALDQFSPERFSDRQKAQTREELGIPPGSLVVVMIARLVRSKGCVLFAETASRLHTQRPELHFLLIGPRDPEAMDGLSDSEMEEICRHVQWIGPKANVERYLAASDLFVLPSGREGISRVLIEAGAMGLPLIATDIPGCQQAVEDGVNGYLIPMNDAGALEEAILKLAASSELRQKFGAASQRHVGENFDLSQIVGRLKEIYQKLLCQKGLYCDLGK